MINNPAKFLAAIFMVWLAVYFALINVFHCSLKPEILISRFFLVFTSIWGVYFLFRNGRVFFSEYTSPINLAVFRIVFYGFISIGFAAPLYLSGLCKIDFPWTEISVAQRTPLPYMSWYIMNLPVSPALVSASVRIIAVSAFSCMIGFRTRFFTIVFFVATFYLNGIPEFFGKVNHNHYIIWFAAILCFASCSDVLSIDSWWNGRAKKAQAAEPIHPQNYYNIPIQLIAILIGIIYFFPGFHKVWTSGLHWAFSDNLGNQIFLKALEIGQLKPDFYSSVLDTPLKMGALLTIVFELSFIFLIGSKKYRWIVITGGVVFHVFGYLFLQINFLYLLACYVVFLDWEKIFAWLGIKIQLPDTSASATLKISLPIIITGALLISLNTAAGMLKINSWPISCFPTFENVVTNQTEELKYVIRHKDVLDKTALRNKYGGTNVRQWEYRILDLRAKQDSIMLTKSATNLLQRIEVSYSTLKSGDTMDVYLQQLVIAKERWVKINADTLIYTAAIKR